MIPLLGHEDDILTQGHGSLPALRPLGRVIKALGWNHGDDMSELYKQDRCHIIEKAEADSFKATCCLASMYMGGNAFSRALTLDPIIALRARKPAEGF